MVQTIFRGKVSVLFVLSVLFFQAFGAIAQEKKNLRIVFVSLSWNNQLPYRIAIAKGFFKDQGLSVEQIFVRGGPTAIAALVSGNVEFGSIGGAQAPIRGNARGLDLQILASLSNYTNYTLLGSKEARSIEELRGKVIGVTGAGAFSDFAIRIFLKRHKIDPDRDVTLRAIGGTALRAVALERGVIAAAPFTAEDTIRLVDKGFPLIVNLNEALRIPQSILVTRGEMLQKYPETSKHFLKAMILGMQVAKHNKKEAIQIGLASGLPGEPELVNRSYDLFSPGYAADLSVAQDGIQIMLDEDIRAGVVDKKFTLDRVINDRILKQAQQELRTEGKLRQ
ncbi:MAG TPA: ABC transporter substrate-binding protein [Candidatus Binatia bacterium]|jgi:ABC-type nitrate/sulfonate/bicarbonate transport system substrate-binding protein